MSNDTRHVRITTSTLSREVQGETVLLQLDRGEYFGLDDIGTRIWQLITETGDLRQVHQRMLEEFDIESVALRKDIDELVAELLARQLIEIDPSPAPHHGAGSSQ